MIGKKRITDNNKGRLFVYSKKFFENFFLYLFMFTWIFALVFVSFSDLTSQTFHIFCLSGDDNGIKELAF